MCCSLNLTAVLILTVKITLWCRKAILPPLILNHIAATICQNIFLSHHAAPTIISISRCNSKTPRTQTKMIKSLSLICTMGGKYLPRELLDASFLSREQSKMASSQFGANSGAERRQRRCLNPVGLRGISSPLFRESLIDTWGLAWRSEDNTSIVSLFSESRRLSNGGVFAGGLARLQNLNFLFWFTTEKLPPPHQTHGSSPPAAPEDTPECVRYHFRKRWQRTTCWTE